MVHKRLCDGCDVELPFQSDEKPNSPTGVFYFREKRYDFCKYCANHITRCIKDLKEKHTIIGTLKKKLAEMKGQKDLTDFT